MEYDCTKCGACCFGPRGWIDVDFAFDNTPENFVDQNFRGDGGWMFMKDGHCTCLESNIGDCRCTIYEARPISFRDFEPGDGPCIEKRSEFGLLNKFRNKYAEQVGKFPVLKETV